MQKLTLEERDARYAAVRAEMKRMGLDAMLVICDAQIEKKGYLKYLTNYRNSLYNLVAIFPLEGEAKMLVPSEVQVFWASRLSWINRVENQTPSLNECLARNIREMGLEKATVGLASPKIMNADTYNYLLRNLPEMTIVDATCIIENLRMVKSPAEIANMRDTAALADYSFQVAAEVLKPGMTERELIAAIDQKLIERGAQDIFHLIQSEPGDLMPFMPKDRPIQEGESVILNNELSGPSGYWSQMVRTLFVGEPKGQTGKMYDDLLAMVNQLPGRLIPGAKVCEIAQWLKDTAAAEGYTLGVGMGHCVGLDIVERPIVNFTETEALRAGMTIVVHPQIISADRTETVWYADMYLIREEGPAEVLTTYAPEKLQV